VSRYIFGRYVEGDLREIRDHIAKDSPVSARRMMVRFVNAFRLPAKQPELGPILAVVHGARDVPVIVNLRAE
jgi:plasmid stabilization system protein ParE